MTLISQPDLIARIRRRLPQHGLAELEGLSGEEVLEVFAAVFERVGRARVAKMRSRLLRDATGAARARTSVTVHFDAPTGPEGYELAAGQPLFATRWGVRFVPLAPITRAANDVTPSVTVEVEAEWAGWDGNVRGAEIVEWAIPNLDDADSLRWVSGSAAARQEFMAQLVAGQIWFEADADATGGRAGTLDIRARGRGLPRAEGEGDSSLRRRLRIVPDAVSPAGIRRAVDKAIGFDGATTISEFWEWAFAFGYSGWGMAAWGKARMFLVLVPPGADVSAVQALVDRIRGAGYYGLVLEEW
jgi:hypothetical protein